LTLGFPGRAARQADGGDAPPAASAAQPHVTLIDPVAAHPRGPPEPSGAQADGRRRTALGQSDVDRPLPGRQPVDRRDHPTSGRWSADLAKRRAVGAVLAPRRSRGGRAVGKEPAVRLEHQTLPPPARALPPPRP